MPSSGGFRHGGSRAHQSTPEAGSPSTHPNRQRNRAGAHSGFLLGSGIDFEFFGGACRCSEVSYGGSGVQFRASGAPFGAPNLCPNPAGPKPTQQWLGWFLKSQQGSLRRISSRGAFGEGSGWDLHTEGCFSTLGVSPRPGPGLARLARFCPLGIEVEITGF